MTNILQDLSVPGLVNAIEENVVEFWAYAGRSSLADFRREPDLLRVSFGVPFPLWNDIAGARLQGEEIDHRIEEALGYFKSRNLPMFWWTGPATRPLDLGDRLAAHGLVLADSPPGMAAFLPDMSEPLSPPELVIEEVLDARRMEQFVQIWTQVFGAPDFAGKVYYDLSLDLGLGPQYPARNFVGLLDGEPVATSTLFLGAGVAGIYNVGTLPQVRGRGIGAALTYAPLRAARDLGYRVGILHASEMGHNIYRHLGFEDYCRMGLYAWLGESPEAAGAH